MKTLGIIILIIVIIIIGAVIYFGYEGSATYAPPVATSTTTGAGSPPVVSAAPSNWKMYSVAPSHLTIEVPPDFTSQAANSGVEFLIPTVPNTVPPSSTSTSPYF